SLENARNLRQQRLQMPMFPTRSLAIGDFRQLRKVSRDTRALAKERRARLQRQIQPKLHIFDDISAGELSPGDRAPRESHPRAGEQARKPEPKQPARSNPV